MNHSTCFLDLGFGSSSLTLLKIKEYDNGETYIIFPIPGESLHISFHKSGVTHLRGRWNRDIKQYEIDLPIDMDLPQLGEDAEEIAEDFVEHIMSGPPENENYLVLPAENIAFLGGFAEVPNSTTLIDVPELISDFLLSCDIMSLEEFMEADNDLDVLGIGLKSKGMLLPLPADSFSSSIFLDWQRLQVETMFGKRFIRPLSNAIETGLNQVRDDNALNYIKNIDQVDVINNFNMILEKPQVLSNLQRIQERFIDDI